jgi:DHA1 family tetracycline resistance protein-like MFS transporter
LSSDKSKRIFVIFLVVFIDLLGFGIVIPLLPVFSQNVLQMHETTIGLVTGIFSLMQFMFTPIWGRLSDIYGRKPIIMFSLTGNVLSYFVLGLVFAGVLKSVILLFVARAMAGLFSGNIGAAMAYISDITSKSERSRGMGIIGASFGLGFVFGPFIGGVLAQRFGFGTPVFLSSILSFTALSLAFKVLKESLPEQYRRKDRRLNIKVKNAVNKLTLALKHPNVGFLILLYFIITFSFSNIFSTFQLYAESDVGFNYNIEQISYLFAYMGLLGAFVQGVLIRPLTKIFDEKKLLIAGNFIMAIGLGTIPFSHHSLFLLLLSVLLLGLGNGLNQPITLSLVSKYTDPDEQGGILGINQSLASLARFLGPSWGGLVYERIGYTAPFLTGGSFMIFGTILSFKLMHSKFKTNKVASDFAEPGSK